MPSPRAITTVIFFPNGQAAVFDQYGKQMPEFQGNAAEMEPKIRAAGFTGAIQRWRLKTMEDTMDAFDKLAADIANASSPFALGRDWTDIQQGFKALAEWKAQVEARLAKLEAPSRLPQN